MSGAASTVEEKRALSSVTEGEEERQPGAIVADVCCHRPAMFQLGVSEKGAQGSCPVHTHYRSDFFEVLPPEPGVRRHRECECVLHAEGIGQIEVFDVQKAACLGCGVALERLVPRLATRAKEETSNSCSSALSASQAAWNGGGRSISGAVSKPTRMLSS